jgi:hypothetical protein
VTLPTLTSREREVIQLMAEGKPGWGGDTLARQKLSCHLFGMFCSAAVGLRRTPASAQRRRVYRRCHRGSLNLNVAIHPHAPLFSSTLRYGRRSSLYASEHNGIGRSGFQVLILKIVQRRCFSARFGHGSY